MNFTIAAIPATMIDLVWDRLIPHLERVVNTAPDEVSLDQIYNHAKLGNVLIVAICKGSDIVAAVTLEVRTFESGLRTLHLPAVGGNEMMEWMDQFLDVAKAIAKDLNCTQLRGAAVRSGWMRVLKDRGWSEVYTIVKCEV